MSVVDLLQPILDGGLQRNNFFNGRLLSAEDLRAEQDATRAQLSRLARGAGDGVAWGLGVTADGTSTVGPRVLVRRGLALNRLGALLHLPEDARVAQVPTSVAAQAEAGLFAECEPPRPTASLSGAGAYVLAAAPASGFSGTAPTSDPNATAAGLGSCGSRFRVEGVRFRLVPVPLGQMTGGASTLRGRAVALLPPANAAARERLRNLLAHLCFGTQSLDRFFAEPGRALSSGGSAWTGWGALDAMRDRGDLTDCDVPLAVVVLTSGGISFVDVWPARRKLLDERAVDAWQPVAGPRRVAEGEAAFLQFQ
ncbi:MAG TPA: hypothetical protein VKA84_13775, partial [Gemmatimonadaceae bacterium]|nr:hypothetical protein [Gemmatimonadaceae bacterium]